MKNILFILMAVMPLFTNAQEKFNYLTLENKEVTFQIKYELQGISRKDIYSKLDPFLKGTLPLNTITTKDSFYTAKIYKAEVDVKKYRREEFGASKTIRSPFSGIVYVQAGEGYYTITVKNIVFESWNLTQPGYPTKKEETSIEDFACNSDKTKFKLNGYKKDDLTAMQAYLSNLFFYPIIQN